MQKGQEDARDRQDFRGARHAPSESDATLTHRFKQADPGSYRNVE